MTNHYNIEVTKTRTNFKATYRDGKFRQLVHLRGNLDDTMLNNLGRIIPRTESDFGKYIDHFFGKVTYEKTVKEKSQYTLFLDAWSVFYSEFSDMTPKFTGADGMALKSIITYLTGVAGSDVEALALWKIILDKWDTLSDFHQANTDLKYINSKLNIILHAIKQQGNTFSSSSNGSVEL